MRFTKHPLSTLLMVGALASGAAACGSASGANNAQTVSCKNGPAPITQQIKQTQKDLDTAKKVANSPKKGTPAGKAADDRVTELQGHLDSLNRDLKTCNTGVDNQLILITGSGCNKTQVATAALEEQGFAPGDFVIGEKNINWSMPVATQHGNGSFTTAKKTAGEWTKWLATDDASAKLVVKQVSQQAGVTKQALLNPKGWVAFQLKVASDWGGNTLLQNGQVKSAGTRHSAAGDAGWLYVNQADCAKLAAASKAKPSGGTTTTTTPAELMSKVRTGAARLGCGNPQTELPKPVPPTSPPHGPTPTTVRPCVVGVECGKDARLSPVKSADNPDQRVRPVITTPSTVIRPPGSQPTQPSPPSTIPDPPQVQHPEPVTPGIGSTPPVTNDPAQTCDNNGDGIPDASCS